ncbi:hypothetical protein [Nonomuraea sp. KM90]|uniref:hypothetical protein n=1 Tax=Nonomuraea sp. KM90 TaxID=3457428 RepID=UPI003FCE996F
MRKILSMLMAASVALVALPTSAGAATIDVTPPPACASSDDKDKIVQDFVERVNKRWSLDINPTDYEVQSDGTGCTVKPKGSAPVQAEPAARSADTAVALSTTVSPPAPAPGAKDGVALMQDTSWWQPTCYARQGDPEGVGWMDTCFQWGSMHYEGATRWNYAARMYASCGALEGGPTFWQVSGCYVATKRAPNSPALVWNDWDPKSTRPLNSCGSVGLSIGVGPVSASYSVNTCDKLQPTKGTEAADLRVDWEGKSYYGEDIRETGLLIGIGSPIGQAPLLNVGFGYTYEECVWPPTPSPYYPWCAI